MQINGIALAHNAVAVLRSADFANGTWYLHLMSRGDGHTLWSTQLPCEPVQNGVAVNRRGDIIVALKSGAVLCYGSGVVSVVAQAPAPEAPRHESGLVSHVTQRLMATPQPAMTAAGRQAVPVPALLLDPAAEAAPLSGTSGAACRLLPETYAMSHSQDNTFTPRNMCWAPARPCLAIAAVYASSSAGRNAATRTVDRDLRTRWMPSGAGPQWLTCDLGSTRDVSAVSAVWYATKASRTPFTIEVSADGKRFEQVDNGAFVGRGTNTVLRTFVPVNARYVRITMDAPVSVYEVGVHGATADQRAAAR